MYVRDLWLADGKALLLRIAPELAQDELYIFNQPTGLAAPAEARAYVTCVASPALQQHLIDLGIWRGPGHSIVFCQPVTNRFEFLVLLLHEGGHLLPRREPPQEIELTPTIIADSRASFADDFAEPVATNLPAWINGDHGRDFTRIALHLWWRAAIAGEVLPMEGLCAGRGYNLSPAWWYWHALGNEAVRMQHKTFTEILATEPPKLFSDLWRGDLARWMELNPEGVKQIKEAAA
jgi:hypothetical protein